MAAVTNAVSLLTDTLRAARALVRGIGGLPGQLGKRVASAHDAAARMEDQSGRAVTASDVAEAVAKINEIMRAKRVAGAEARVFADNTTEHVVIAILPPLSDAQQQVLARDSLELIATLDDASQD